MSTINIKCVDQVLSFQNMPIITAGDQNVDKIQFDFCPTWDGFVKVAVFFQQKTECSSSIIGADGVCNIPNSILQIEGKIFVAVTGVNTKNQILTSNIVSYYIGEGVVDASLQDEFPTDITPEEQESIYHKILEMCVEMQTLCQDLIKNFAYVRVKGANEFEYDEAKLEAKIKGYTYTREKLDNMFTDMRDDFTRTTSSIKNDLTALSNSVDNRVRSLTGSIDINTNNILDNSKAISQLETSITSEKSDRQRGDASLTATINSTKTEIMTTVSSLSSQVTTLNNYVTAILETLNTLDARIKELEG